MTLYSSVLDRIPVGLGASGPVYRVSIVVAELLRAGNGVRRFLASALPCPYLELYRLNISLNAV
jgi:hypothetical protein